MTGVVRVRHAIWSFIRARPIVPSGFGKASDI